MIHSGFSRLDESGSGTWETARDWIGSHVKHGVTVISLSSWDLPPGSQFQLGDATITILSGLPEWPDPPSWLDSSSAEKRNVISVTAKLEYGGNSVLFAGDVVGRRVHGAHDEGCLVGEAALVAAHEAGTIDLASTVLVAPHHGADNANSTCFIEAVSPERVVFSAGSKFKHPRAAAAQRYLSANVTPPIEPQHIFRTDFGDDEDDGEGAAEDDGEWNHGRVLRCNDESEDDPVGIILHSNGDFEVAYGLEVESCD
ncbi:MAG: hypothetical protein GY937_16850 [bacterium]|nr:hypothetical protein [bacterium]